MKQRGRPLKFGRPAQLRALTLPLDVVRGLRRIHPDPGWAIVSLYERLADKVLPRHGQHLAQRAEAGDPRRRHGRRAPAQEEVDRHDSEVRRVPGAPSVMGAAQELRPPETRRPATEAGRRERGPAAEHAYAGWGEGPAARRPRDAGSRMSSRDPMLACVRASDDQTSRSGRSPPRPRGCIGDPALDPEFEPPRHQFDRDADDAGHVGKVLAHWVDAAVTDTLTFDPPVPIRHRAPTDVPRPQQITFEPLGSRAPPASPASFPTLD